MDYLKYACRFAAVISFLVLIPGGELFAQPFKHLSTASGDIAIPWAAHQQTASVIADLNKDGKMDFILAERDTTPAIVWYEQKVEGWQLHVLENSKLPIEAGGACADLDGDGDLDLVLGGDWQSENVWWWENPFPDQTVWKRHEIKTAGAHQHHDQLIGSFLPGKNLQLIFWNQQARTLFMAEVPPDPKITPWVYRSIFEAGKRAESHGTYVEGLAEGDIDGDGILDIVAGNYWLKYQSDGHFKATRFAEMAGRVQVGKFQEGKGMQIVVSPGDGQGPLKWYEFSGDPTDTANWAGHDLAGRDLVHGHSLVVADINGDGNQDIFAAEMAQWTESRPDADNPNAEAFLFFGDGKGHFKGGSWLKGFDFHEARWVDLDGDGDLDLLSKPYTWKTPRIDIWLQEK